MLSELRVSKWSMLGKMMKLIYENYIAHYSDNEDKLKEDFIGKMAAAKSFLEKDFSESEVTFQKFVNKFRDNCLKNSSGLANNFTPILDIYNLNWFYKTLQIHIEEQSSDRAFDSEEVGAGMQNLLMISIFQTYAELMGGKVIFGIEEPELYLYPQAQRALYKNLKFLSRNTQIFYTTHNPNFVDAIRADDIILIRKSPPRGTYKLKKKPYFNTKNAIKDGHQHRIYTHFSTEKNELFFAKKALLVEGDSDKILFTTLCEKMWKIDLDQQGVSIISCGGKGGVKYFIGVCHLVGFNDYFAIWDQDENLDDEKILIETLKKQKGLSIQPNLEVLLNLDSRKEAAKVKNAYEWAFNASTEDVPIEFNKIKNFLMETN